MHEPAMTFDGIVLSPQKEVVRVFFKEMWDKGDKSLIPKIFQPDFTSAARSVLNFVGTNNLPVTSTW